MDEPQYVTPPFATPIRLKLHHVCSLIPLPLPSFLPRQLPSSPASSLAGFLSFQLPLSPTFNPLVPSPLASSQLASRAPPSFGVAFLRPDPPSSIRHHCALAAPSSATSYYRTALQWHFLTTTPFNYTTILLQRPGSGALLHGPVEDMAHWHPGLLRREI